MLVLLSAELLHLAELLLSLLVLLAKGLELLLIVLAAEARPVFAVRFDNLNLEVPHLLLQTLDCLLLSAALLAQLHLVKPLALQVCGEALHERLELAIFKLDLLLGLTCQRGVLLT